MMLSSSKPIYTAEMLECSYKESKFICVLRNDGLSLGINGKDLISGKILNSGGSDILLLSGLVSSNVPLLHIYHHYFQNNLSDFRKLSIVSYLSTESIHMYSFLAQIMFVMRAVKILHYELHSLVQCNFVSKNLN